MDELVSIIIPAYQEEKRIERCLRSIFASTYRNLELIVVNDGSTDGTEKAVKSFKKQYESKDRVLKLITVSNGGSARARNIGLRLAKGDYIGFADADDMIQPDMLEKLVKSLRKGYVLSICGLLFCDETGKPGFFQYPVCEQRRQCPEEALKMAMWEQIQMSVCSVLFRREIAINEDGESGIFFPEDVVAFEDFAFICEYISRCNGLIEVLPFRGYLYCNRAGSSTAKMHTAKEIRYALQPVLDAGKRINDTKFIAHKLQYAFRFMALWYENAARSSWQDFFGDCENRKICMQELERYADIYMGAREVALYKKTAMWIIRKYPKAGWILAKTAGKLIINDKKDKFSGIVSN